MPNCGGFIQTFDETTKKGFCPYCDALIVDVFELQGAYEVRAADSVVVEGIESASQMLERASGFAFIGKGGKAISLLREYVDKYPTNLDGWLMLCEMTARFSPGSSLSEHAETIMILSRTSDKHSEVRGLLRTLEETQKKLLSNREEILVDIANKEERIGALQATQQSASDKLEASRMAEEEGRKSLQSLKKEVQELEKKGEKPVPSGAIRFGVFWGALVGTIGGIAYTFWKLGFNLAGIVFSIILGAIGALAGAFFGPIVVEIIVIPLLAWLWWSKAAKDPPRITRTLRGDGRMSMRKLE